MVKVDNREVALMSIHPIYAEKILSGKKQVEFRKTLLKKDVKYILIYATSPKKKLVGYFNVLGIEIDTPKAIWDKYSDVGCVDNRFYWSYYGGKDRAVAIKVGSVFELRNPIDLNTILDKNPPQSYYYLDSNTVELFLGYL